MSKEKSKQQQKVDERNQRLSTIKNIEYDCRENCLTPVLFSKDQDDLLVTIDLKSLKLIHELITIAREAGYRQRHCRR